MKEASENISYEETMPDDTLYVESAGEATDESGDNGNSTDDGDTRPVAGKEQIPADVADEMARKAYIRGRNEAIAGAMAGETHSPALEAANLTPGTVDPATPPSDPDLAEIFSFRPSVWQ